MDTDRLRWLYFRLRAMSLGELIHRMVEFGKRQVDQHRDFVFDGPLIPLPVIHGLRERVLNAPPGVREAFHATARDVRDGRYCFLGQAWPQMGSSPDWHLDPVTQRVWPKDMFCFSLPFRHNREYGDVKFVWEINRLQHLQHIAAAAACDCDSALTEICISQIRSWIAANPPFQGINWSSGIELALRLISLVIVLSLIPETAFSEADQRAIGATVRAHLYWLARYPSRYSSANNHLVAEAAALFVLGTLAPDLRHAKHAAAYGRRVLNEEALNQILPDGVPAEQSPTYGAFTVEWMLVAHAAALAAGLPGLEQSSLNRLAAFDTFLNCITDSAGNVPRIGDDDEGRVIFGKGNSNDYLASVSAGVAVLTGRPIHVREITKESLRSIILSVPVPPRQPPKDSIVGIHTFPDGGYSVVRDRMDARECLLIFDHGPLGYLNIAAHGHADALAIWLHIDGRPVLVDAGTYLYHSGAEWRRHFRGTTAHNTLVLGESDQSVQAGDFNWSLKADARLISVSHELEKLRIVAEHEGYLERFGIVHRRSIERICAGRYTIEDTLISERRVLPSAETGYLVSPDLSVREIKHGWSIANEQGSLVSIECPDAGDRCIQRGIAEPFKRGWVSPVFGNKEPAWRLVARPSAGSRKLTTIIALAANGI